MPFAPSTVKVVTSADGTPIFAEATGNHANPHVVLTAGLGLSASIYDEFVQDKQLLDSLYIVRYDIRGHGRSGKPSDAASYESQRFAEDFKAVIDAFKLDRPIYAGWSMGSTVATDIAAHLPPATISGVVYISGIPSTGEIIGELANPGLVAALPGLLNAGDVNAWRTSAGVFVEKLFAKPDSVPWSVKTTYLGNSLSPEITGFSLTRTMDVEKFWAAGKEGLPIYIVQGVLDGHRIEAPKTVEDIVKPHFVNYKSKWLEGIGHAVHYEAPEALAEVLIEWGKKYSGKDYRAKV